jgi:hypothetical protein
MKRSTVIQSVFVLLVLGLLAGSFFAGRFLAGPKAVQARTEPNPVSPASIEASLACHINNVAAFDNRIHVRCDEYVPETAIHYFAYATDGWSGYTANRMLAVAQTAFALGKPVWVYYVSSSSSNPPGCNTSDCRLLTGISMVN